MAHYYDKGKRVELPKKEKTISPSWKKSIERSKGKDWGIPEATPEETKKAIDFKAAGKKKVEDIRNPPYIATPESIAYADKLDNPTTATSSAIDNPTANIGKPARMGIFDQSVSQIQDPNMGVMQNNQQAPSNLTPEQQTIMNNLNDVGDAGQKAAGIGAIGGIATAAVGLAVPTGGASLVIGGVAIAAGALTTYLWRGESAKKALATQATKVEGANYNMAIKNIKVAIDRANQGIGTPGDNFEMYRESLSAIDQAEANMLFMNNVRDSAWLKNQDELNNIANFNAYYRGEYTSAMDQALRAPNKMKVISDPKDIMNDYTMEDLQQ
jgi:hypothetical protein